jgi:hypothetical protein
MSGLLAVTAALWAVNDFVIENATPNNVILLLFARAASGVALGGALLPAFGTGKWPTFGDGLALGSLLAGAYGGLALALLTASPLQILPVYFLWPIAALLFEAVFNSDDIDSTDAAIVSLLSVAGLVLFSSSAVNLRAASFALVAAVCEGTRLAFFTTPAIKNLQTNTKIFVESIPLTVITGLLLVLQRSSAKLNFQWTWLMPITGWVASYLLYNGLQRTDLRRGIGLLLIEIMLVLFVFLIFKIYPFANKSEFVALCCYVAAGVVASVAKIENR